MYGPVPQFNPGPRLAAPSDWHERGKKWAQEGIKRMPKHGMSVLDSLYKPGPDLVANWIYFILKVLASVATIFLLIVLIMVGTTTITGDNSDSAVYVTNTFYTSNDNEQNISWPVLTSSSWNGLPRPNNGLSYGAGLQFEHFYECMWVAQEGWGLCNGSAASVATYTTCLTTSYSSQLASCAPSGQPALWPTSNQYSQCINAGLGGNVLWNLNAFRTCIKEDLWPLYEVPQDVTSNYFLGAYSWPLLLVTSLFLLTVFALYTIWPVDWEDATVVEQGKPASSFVRLGMAWSGIAILVAAVWLIVALLIAFRTGGVWPNNNVNLYPSTQQTNVVMVVTTLSVIFYFLFDASEFQASSSSRAYERGQDAQGEKGDGPPIWRNTDNGDSEWAYGRQAKIPVPFSMGPGAAPGGANALGYFFPPGTQPDYQVSSLELAGRFYSPVLLKTWSDAYLLDALFVAGVVGGTLQVFTADIFNLFFCILFYRIAHLGVSRAGYFAYISVFQLGDSQPQQEAKKEAIAATKVLALAMHVAGLCALIVPIYIVFDSTRMLSDYSVLAATFYLCYIIPEVIRFIGHFLLSVLPAEYLKDRALYILIFAQFIWAWDLIVRAVLLWLLLWGNSGSRGTKPYLTSGIQSIQAIIQL